MDQPAAERPFSSHERMIAWRFLRARRREGGVSVIAWFSFVGILLGVGTLIVVMAVMVGFRVEFVSRILGVNGHVLVLPATAEGFSDYEALTERIRRAPGVLRAAPIVEAQIMATTKTEATGALVRGVRPEDLKTIPLIAKPEDSRGNIEDFRAGAGVAMGLRMANRLGLDVGDGVTLISPKGRVTALGPGLRKKTYRITYLFQVGRADVDDILVYVPLKDAQIFFLKKGKADQIEVMVDAPDDTERLQAGIFEAAGEPVRFWNWKQQNGAFLQALDVERVMMFIILSLLVLIAALNIISGLVMLVKNKGGDIGILRTMGLSRGGVMRVFMMCGAAIGVSGTIAGVIAGVAFAANIQSILGAVTWALGMDVWDPSVRLLTTIPAELRVVDIGAATALSLALSFLVTLIPSWRAARLDPVEALRYE